VNLYRGGHVALQHLDLYRLAGPSELFALGFEDLLAEPAATLCEWADRAGPALPADRLEILLEPTGPEERRATPRAHGARATQVRTTMSTVSASAAAASSNPAAVGSQRRARRVKKTRKQRSLSVSPRSLSRSAASISASTATRRSSHSGTVPLCANNQGPHSN